ncbi:amino acid adenylation domain-containing protein [Vibrio xiamenensis]|uniref:Amino acid adenylation domain-containing protein n=1 Tax=Vibrio xiamenensis TaxID=861298 RepID=A0A1G8DHT2_9VIBR|nr:non-ribosomal peptide synthetase [Vibrio xiamenensis]SDH57255.1 amino acid adenylation domain-containing protein [Vibrio xiamenensis]
MADITGVDLDSLSPEEMMALLEQLESDGVALFSDQEPQESRIEAHHLSSYPLSLAQQRLWFLAQMGQASDNAYLIEGGIRLKGHLDHIALERALNQMVVRHGALRTRIATEHGEPCQLLDNQQREFALERVAMSETQARQTPFAPNLCLQNGPLVAARVVEISPDEHWLQVAMHHIISDGWSMGVFTQEFCECYRAEVSNSAANLAPLAIEYGDYALWQRRFRESALQEQAEYWQRQLRGVPDCLSLPYDYPRPEVQSFDGGAVDVALDAPLTQKLKALNSQHGCTLYMTLLASWACVLARLSQQDDIVIGSPIAGRLSPQVEPLIGMFVNSQALRVDLSQPLSTHQLLKQVKQTTLDAQTHQELPFERVVELVKPARSLQYSPVFQVMFALQNLPSAAIDLPQLSASMLEQPTSNAKFDLTLVVNEVDGEIRGQLNYATALFSQASAERFVKYWQTLLGAMIANPNATVQQLDMLPEDEKHQLLNVLNPAKTDESAQGSVEPIHHQIERLAIEHPNAIALDSEQGQLSYQQLNQQANQLAHWMIIQGVDVESRVAICCDRGHSWVIAMLAALKAGAGYVPIDPHYPAERIEYMLSDSEPSMLLCDDYVDFTPIASRLSLPLTMVNVEVQNALWKALSTDNPVLESLTGDNLAYVIYTSGSTGKPKGVMVEHRNLANLIAWHNRRFDIQVGTHTSAVAGLGFDAAVWEVWPALCAGACLCLPSLAISREPQALLDWWVNQPIEVGFLSTPVAELAFARNLQPKQLRVLLVGGDRLNRRAPAGATYQLVNNYGPTETTVVATSGTLFAEDPLLHIGQPLDNTHIYILDSYGQLAPSGTAGELYIGGASVARGYLNREDLTATSYLPDPYSSAPNARMYRSGDLARWRADGVIEYLGRNDDQVKIRGFRIELGEITAVLQRQADIEEAVVAAIGEQNKRLVAYFTHRLPAKTDISKSETSQNKIDIEALRQALAAELPDYMLPSAFVELEVMPLTANGKVDKRALPAPSDDAMLRRDYQAPVGEAEIALAKVWQMLLDVQKVGRLDNFFELGGHSLLAIQLIERLQQSGWTLSIKALFSQPTLQALAKTLTQSGDEAQVAENVIPAQCTRITPQMLPLVTLSQTQIDAIAEQVDGGMANIQDIYPLVALQEGMLYHHLLEQQGDPYVSRFVQAFSSQGSLEQFMTALNQVIARHDILRTAMAWQGLNEPVQVVWREAPVRLNSLPETDFNRPGMDAAKQLLEHFDPATTRMSLVRAPLMEAYQVYDQANQRWLLCLLVHHLVNDHTTLELMVEEVTALLTGQPELLSKPVPFRQFVAKARSVQNTPQQQAYFEALLSDVDEPSAPFGLMEAQVGNQSQHTLTLDAQISDEIRALVKQHQVSSAALFHLAWGVVLSAAVGREDVVFGTVLFGRMGGGANIDRCMGMFLNTLPVRIDLGKQQVGDALLQVQRQLSQLMEHEHAPLALAQRCSGLAAQTPLFSSMVNYRYQQVPSQHTDSQSNPLGIEVLFNEERTSYPISVNINDHVGGGFSLEIHVENSIGAARVAEMMHAAVCQLVAEPSSALATINVVSKAEREQVLEGFNRTTRDYPLSDCIHHPIEARAKASPERIAVISGEQRLTYAELNQQANQLALWLTQQGVGPDCRVAVSLDRSCELVVALVAILKAGGAYVPMDPSYPTERLEYMLQDSEPVVLITSQSLQSRLGHIDDKVQVVHFDHQPPWQHLPSDNLNSQALGLSERNLAYVIYTSGSTGKPKGVMNEHRGVVNRLAWMAEDYGFSEHDVVLQKTPFSFDVSVWEFFCPLWVGATLVMAKPEGHKDPRYLQEIIHQQQVTILHFVPPMLQLFLDQVSRDECASLRLVFCSGEALPAETIRRTYAALPHVELHNLYGPTEAAVDVTQWHCPVQLVGNRVTIGQSVANTRMYVLDKHQQPVPIGVPGEIYIGGVQVARGYLNRPELSAEKFVCDPYASQPNATMYQTGDVGRWLDDGSIEYLGRNDDQVKIRGLRMELGEISSALKGCPGVIEAVVIAKGQAENKHLVGYYTASEPMANATIKAELSQSLPDYMVPAALVQIDQIPLTPNGKMDRKALPEPNDDAFERREYVAPQGQLEVTLSQIWQSLLGTERVSRLDNFFEIGGHSLLAVKLCNELQQQGYAISLAQLLSAPVLADLANTLQSHSQSQVLTIAFRQTGSQTPLFIVPEASGETLYGPALTAHIDSDIPVYGLVAPNSHNTEQYCPLKTIEKMAEHYVTCIQQVQPQGPYRLVGWSLGATLAYEVATQLLGQDQAIEFLGIIDRWGVEQSEHRGDVTLSAEEDIEFLSRDTVSYLIQHLPSTQDGASRLAQCSSWQQQLELAKQLGILSSDWSEERYYHWLLQRRNMLRAEYCAKPLPVNIDLFIARERPEQEGVFDPYLAWDEVLPRSAIEVSYLDGSHYELLVEPYVSGTGRALSQALAKRVATSSSLTPTGGHDAIIKLQPGRAGAAQVFCIPGAGDNVFSLMDLVTQLDDSLQVYGIQPRGLWGAEPPHSQVSAAAKFYLDAMQAQLSGAPLHLVGHSFGGWVALELANQLEAQGIAVASLTLADSRVPEAQVQEYSDVEALMKLIGLFEMQGSALHLTQEILESLEPNERLRRLQQSLISQKLMPANLNLQTVAGIYRVFARNIRTGYSPTRVPITQVSLLLASDSERGEKWQSLIGHLHIEQAKANHVMLLKGEHAKQLAKLIKA